MEKTKKLKQLVLADCHEEPLAACTYCQTENYKVTQTAFTNSISFLLFAQTGAGVCKLCT